jgi:hypothetical protein
LNEKSPTKSDFDLAYWSSGVKRGFGLIIFEVKVMFQKIEFLLASIPDFRSNKSRELIEGEVRKKN